jgi:hypothetical protein
MKPYLLAPIAIAGIITATGTSTIAATEMKLFKSGQEFVASLTPDIRANQADAIQFNAVRDEVASNWQNDFKLDEINAQLAGMPAPETAIQAVPADEDEKVCGEEAKACEEAEVACKKAKAVSDAAKARARARQARHENRVAKAPVAPKAALAASYSFRTLPAPEVPENVALVVNAGDDKFVHLSTLPRDGEFRMMFDGKKFAEERKMFIKDFEKMQVKEWKSLSADELKKLRQFGVKIEVKGDAAPAVTINPLQIAASVDKVGFAALNDADRDADQEDEIIATPK